MTDEHPIIPLPELVGHWLSGFYGVGTAPGESSVYIATKAAQWGADVELEACVGWINKQSKIWTSDQLRAARRPKPPSLKQQALDLLDKAEDPYWCINDFSIVRRALESIDD